MLSLDVVWRHLRLVLGGWKENKNNRIVSLNKACVVPRLPPSETRQQNTEITSFFFCILVYFIYNRPHIYVKEFAMQIYKLMSVKINPYPETYMAVKMSALTSYF